MYIFLNLWFGYIKRKVWDESNFHFNKGNTAQVKMIDIKMWITRHILNYLSLFNHCIDMT